MIFFFYGFWSRRQFEDLCRKVYFPIEPVPADELTLFYGTISIIAQSIDPSPDHNFSTEGIELTRSLCKKNFLQGVQTYEVMALPSRNRVLALLLAVRSSVFQIALLLAESLQC